MATLKKLGGNGVVASVLEALKDKSQARHYKRPAVDDAFHTSSKKPRLKQASCRKFKGTQVKTVPTIVSDGNGLFPALGTAPVGSNSSTPVISNNITVEARTRKVRKARRKSYISTPRITEWLLGCPSPSPKPTPVPGVANSPEKPKKKRTRRQLHNKTTSKVPPASSVPAKTSDSSSVPVIQGGRQDGQGNERRQPSMSPELRARQCSLDTLVTCSPSQQLMQMDGSSKDV